MQKTFRVDFKVANGLKVPGRKRRLRHCETAAKIFCIAWALPCVMTWAAEGPDWKSSPEQIAAAKQLATDLGVVLKEDALGNVVLLDTAAKRSWVDDRQMQEILVFPHLQRLTVEGPSISDQLAPSLARQTALTSLAMRNTLISDKGIAQLAKLDSLKIIDLRLSPLLTDKSAAALAAMTSLRAVRISGVNMTDAGVKKLLKLPRLTEIDVRNCRKVTRAGIAAIAGKKTLRVLKIGGRAIDDDVLKIVAKMNHLTGLSLDNCDISDTGVQQLRSLALTSLTIYQAASVTDQGLAALTAFDQLKALTLRDVPATCEALAGLPHPEKLQTLNVAQSGITDKQIVLLAKMTGLEKLILNETALTDAAVEVLSGLKSLKYLEATQTQISVAGVARLHEALPNCSIRTN